MKGKAKRKLAFLAGFTVYFGVIWFLWNESVIYPLKIFVVFLHEISHALAILATGGAVEGITLDPNQGGVTYGRGGSRVVALSAGYLGSLVWGCLLVMAAHARRVRPSLVTGAVGVLVLGLTALYLRNLFSVVFGLAFGAALIASGRHLGAMWNARLLLVLGLTSCLYAILDIKSDVIDRPGLRSDAAMLAEITAIPTAVWGGLWIVVALAVSVYLFRWAYQKA